MAHPVPAEMVSPSCALMHPRKSKLWPVCSRYHLSHIGPQACQCTVPLAYRLLSQTNLIIVVATPPFAIIVSGYIHAVLVACAICHGIGVSARLPLHRTPTRPLPIDTAEGRHKVRISDSVSALGVETDNVKLRPISSRTYHPPWAKGHSARDQS